MREHRLGEHVVSEPVRHARKRVRREGRHDEQVPAPEMRIRILTGRTPCQRDKGLARNEPLGPRGENRFDVVSCPYEQAHERARLVGRYPAGDSEQDARHAPSLSSWERGA